MKPGNRNLVSLKCLLLCFFGGVGCLFPFLPLHMRDIGLTVQEAHIVSIVAPLVALIGPLLAGLLADRLGLNGWWLRTLIALSTVLAAISYSLLLAIPTVERLEARQPAVSFTCGESDAAILQERCMEQSSCYHWAEEKVGPLRLSDCQHHCQPDKGRESEFLEGDYDGTTPLPDGTDNTNYDDGVIMEAELDYAPERHALSSSNNSDPRHVCTKDAGGLVTCQVYTNSTQEIVINASLLQATNPSASRQKWCRYPLGGEVFCRIPQMLLAPMGHTDCIVVCSVDEPHPLPGSVLAQSQCQRIVGDPEITFWTYLLVRSVADIFPSTAVALLNTAILIATRETSFGQADVGRQLAFGSFGLALFPPVVGLLTHTNLLDLPHIPALIAFAGFAILMVVSALIVLFAKSMPLGTPEWWWSPKLGEGGRKWGGEFTALLFILVLLGAFCSAVDSYLPWHLDQLHATSYYIGLMVTAGALPAIPFLWHSEKLVDYCGHSNLLITAFTFYIIRYTGLSFFTHVWLTSICQALELFTLSIMWVTAIIYVRHLVPHHLTATGQGAAVVAHFGLGRSLGAVLAALLTDWSDQMTVVYHWGAASAAVVATLYFVLYHCCWRPRCLESSQTRHATIVQDGPPTNGSYTPLRVYNNGNKAEKQKQIK